MLIGAGLVGLMRAAARREEFSDEPQIISGSPRIEALANLARRLATENPRDDECVSELLAAAGRRHRDLRKAAADVRFGGAAKESRQSERANRLLLAAWSGQPVATVSPELDDLLTRIDDLYSVPVEVAFASLTELRPGLADLQGQFEGKARGAVDQEAAWDELFAALEPMLGPEADSSVSDPLLRSESAHNIARLFLALKAGLIDGVDYD
jgi:hypothetical protein